jgi:hypothetical protein
MTFAAFSIIRAMSTRNDDPAHASRPFDETRDGFVMGEGSAVLVLAERGRALARGAKVYAELIGYAFTNDAYHMAAPRPDGRQAARAMREALADGDVAPAEVGYVNAHGSSTPLNDPTETGAIKRVFGDHAYRLIVSGTKGYYGHALGASGAIELRSARSRWTRVVAAHDQPGTISVRPRLHAAGRTRGRARNRPLQLVRLRRNQRVAGVAAELAAPVDWRRSPTRGSRSCRSSCGRSRRN